jgi:WD40 repeat protein
LLAILYEVKSFCLNYTVQDVTTIDGSYFSPDGSTFATGSGHNTVNFWDKYNKTLKNTYNYGTWVDRVTYSKNGKYVAVVGGKTVVHIVNSTNYQYIISLRPEGVGYYVLKADFRYDDKMLLICGSNNTIQFYNVP